MINTHTHTCTVSSVSNAKTTSDCFQFSPNFSFSLSMLMFWHKNIQSIEDNTKNQKQQDCFLLTLQNKTKRLKINFIHLNVYVNAVYSAQCHSIAHKHTHTVGVCVIGEYKHVKQSSCRGCYSLVFKVRRLRTPLIF